MYIGRGDCRRMNELGLAVDTNMRLHPKVPLVALLRLMHRRIASALLVLRRGRRVDQGRMYDGSARHGQSVLRQILVHPLKQRVAEILALHQVVKLADRRLVRHRPAASPLGLGVVRRNHLRQHLPGNDLVYLGQKLLFAGVFLVFLEGAVDKAGLAHALNP